MNEVLKALKERRSIRKFKDEMPPKQMIEQILEAGLYAPSGMNRQGVITLAVTNQEMRDRLMKANRAVMGSDEGDPFYGAPVVLVVLADKANRNYMYDGTLVMSNLLLAAHALGLGSIWIHRAKQEFETEEFRSLLKDLGIEGEWEGIGHCCIGYKDCADPEPAPRKENRIYWID